MGGTATLPAAEHAAQQILEGVPEVAREQRIDQRIDRGIAVAQPEQHGEQQRLNAFRAEATHQVHGEEWQPAQDEQAHNDGQRFGCFRFDAEAFRLRLDVPDAAAHDALLVMVVLLLLRRLLRRLLHRTVRWRIGRRNRHRRQRVTRCRRRRGAHGVCTALLQIRHALDHLQIVLLAAAAMMMMMMVVQLGCGHFLVAVVRSMVHGVQDAVRVMGVRGGGRAGNVLGGRVRDRDFDLVVLVVGRAEV